MFAQLQQEHKREYSKILHDIEVLLNKDLRGLKSNNTIKPLLVELKESYGEKLSKENLKSLITKSSINKSDKILTLLKNDGLKVRKELKLTHEQTATLKEVKVDYGFRKDGITRLIIHNEKKFNVCNPYTKKSGVFFEVIQV